MQYRTRSGRPFDSIATGAAAENGLAACEVSSSSA
jgi:hypothetical protein